MLTHPIHTRKVRLQVLQTRSPIGKAEFVRYLNAVAIAEIRVSHLHPPSPRRHGAFATRCGELSVAAGGSVQPAVVYGTLSALDQGEPLRLRPCGRSRTLYLDAGTNTVVAPAGKVMQPDHLVLDSPAPEPLAAPVTPTLRSAGTASQGSQTGIRPAVSAPSWLVLGETYSSGWRAWCRDAAGHERALGAPVPIDGYANGWRIDASCVSARMAFAAQSAANLAYLVSAIAAVLLIGLALGLRLPARIRGRLAAIRRVAPATPVTQTAPVAHARRPADRPPLVLSLPAALAWGIGVGAITAFVFALRFGAVMGVATVVLVLVGVSVQRLVTIAIAAMIAIPLIYLVHPAHNYGGYSFYFSLHELLAHWVGAGVVCTLVAAALLAAREVRSWRGGGGQRPRARRGQRGSPSPNGKSARLRSRAWLAKR